MPDPLRIDIENATVEISPEGFQDLLEGRGTELRFSHLEFRLSAAALQGLVARLMPADGAPARAEVTPQGVLLEGGKDGRRLSIRLDTTSVRLQPGEGELLLITEGGERG
jgi:hypothetical protein